MRLQHTARHCIGRVRHREAPDRDRPLRNRKTYIERCVAADVQYISVRCATALDNGFCYDAPNTERIPSILIW